MCMLRAGVCIQSLCRMLLRANPVRIVLHSMQSDLAQTWGPSVHMCPMDLCKVWGGVLIFTILHPWILLFYRDCKFLAISELEYFMRFIWSLLSMAALSSARWL